MDRKTAAGTLREIGRLLEVEGANVHRVRAFAGAARAVETIETDLDELIASGAILRIRGIGKGTAGVLAELGAGERPQALVDAEARIPPGVREMMSLPGLGPKKVGALWRDLGLESLGELEYACRENRLLDLKGFGSATQRTVLDGLAFHNRARERRLVHEAWKVGAELERRLNGVPGVGAVNPAGELRRATETVGELAYLVTPAEGGRPETVAGALGGDVERITDDQWLWRSSDGLDVRLWFAAPDDAGWALIRATGSGAFVAALEERAGSSDAVRSLEGIGDEAAVFAALGLAWVPPELRDDAVWIDAAARGRLPRLVEAADFQGVLHNHTTDSDGVATLEQMAAAAAARGWSFFGVADHSPAAFYANGVDADRLRDQWSRADAWNDAHPELRVVKGLEADILASGELDIPDGCESGLDYSVASVHSSFRLAEKAQTERLVTAVSHPACRVLGHPTGRLLLARPGYAFDLDRVLDACAEHGVAVEVNASPYRLDLDAGSARRALDRGLTLVVNPDAHAVGGLDDVRWGVAVARRAGATADDLVNCRGIDEFLAR